MEEVDRRRLRTLLTAFCGKNRLSRSEELFIGDQLRKYAPFTATPVDTSGAAYERLVKAIKERVPGIQNEVAFNGARLNELFHRTRYGREGVKRWNMPEFFDYLYEYIARSENRTNIRSRFFYLYALPQALLDNYEQEEIIEILGGRAEAIELIQLLRLRAEELPIQSDDTSAIFDDESSEPGFTPPPVGTNIQKLQRRLRQAYLFAAFLGVGSLVFASLYFLNHKLPNEVAVRIDYEALQGDSLGQFSMAFRSKDTLEKLWHFPQLTFYSLKNQPDNDDCFLVKMQGLYRLSEKNWAPHPIKHIGFARVYGTFIQFELEPEEDQVFQLYGKWFANVYAKDPRPIALFQPDNYIYGTGGGISHYKTGEGKRENISNYVLIMYNSSSQRISDAEILSQMTDKLEIKSDAIKNMPDSVKLQLLRTMFNGN